MPKPKGHKVECKCIICRRIDSKVTEAEVKAVVVRKKTLKTKVVAKDKVAVKVVPLAVGQHVVMVNDFRFLGNLIPKGSMVRIEGIVGTGKQARYKVEFRKKYPWVTAANIKKA